MKTLPQGIPDPTHWTEAWMPLIAPTTAIAAALIIGFTIQCLMPPPKHLYNRETRRHRWAAFYLVLIILSLFVTAVWEWDRYR